jgi:tRNA(Ile)-lysidine synthase
MPPSWLASVERIITRWRAGAGGLGASWVVAVSGGSDSVGLLRVLHTLAPRLGLSLSVAHLDHRVRGDAARADAAFVAELAATLGLPFDLGHWQPDRPGHFEADARRARYAWLAEVAGARGANGIAVGHTRDDQAETILHRIVRGTGLRGLAGIPPRRRLAEGLTLVRPLLNVSREEIRAYLRALGQSYREDTSNADVSRTRARIRHDLLPRLAQEYNPRVVEALVRLGALAGVAGRQLDASLSELERAVLVSANSKQVILKGPVFRRAPEWLHAEVLRRFWRRAGWPEAGMNAARWQQMARLAREEGSRASVGGGVELATDSLFVVLVRVRVEAPAAPVAATPLSLPVPGDVEVPWAGVRIIATLDSAAPRDETLDLDALVLPLLVRAPVAGDRFEPLGMGGQSTPLNDFFRSRRVRRAQRASVPLVCDQRGIVWVVGHRIAHRVRRTDATRRTLDLHLDRLYSASDPT